MSGELVYFIYPDHLGTARLITNTSGQVVWRNILGEPFGNSPPEENPSGLGTFKMNIRGQGQYADKETNLFYNGARYYDPSIGRFPQAEPLGLAGGSWSLYPYALSNPLSYTDPDGRSPLLAVGLGAAAAFYFGVDQLSTVLQAKWKFDELQQLQDLKNAQLGACLNNPQGGGCAGLQQTEKAINQCARESVPAASDAAYSPIPGPLDKVVDMLKRVAK